MTFDVDRSGLPNLVPARMVNEFEYCPRLFYLEWVQSQFEDNPDTVDGRWKHRAVDVERGRALLPGDSGDEIAEARSVLLGSERLGLIGRADIIEGDGGVVRPVDVKRGSPPDDAPAWSPEMVQLCAIGLLLRDNGYACDEGVLYFSETRQRVTVPFDDDLVEKTLGLVEQLRATAAAPDPPPPLVDSPKCPRCSLVGICMPDEINHLANRSRNAPRRLVPSDSAARPMYVTEPGASLGLRSGRVVVTHQGDTVDAARFIDVSQINLIGNVQISSQLLRSCFAEDVPVLWFSYGGWFSGMAEGMPSKHVALRHRQYGIAAQAGLPVARKLIYGKIRNSRTLLRRNSRSDVDGVVGQLKSLGDQAAGAVSIESLLGFEGTAARLYFSRFSAMLRSDELGTFDFSGRNRRPPRDAVNCLLSFAYSLLVKDLTSTVFAVGFDPYIGFYHRPRFGRPALALDLAEEFRPIIADSVVINAINNGEVRRSHFITRAGGVSLTAEGRRAFLAAYERRLDHEIRHPIFGYRITYRRVFEVQARLLAAHLLGEIADYTPFMTR